MSEDIRYNATKEAALDRLDRIREDAKYGNPYRCETCKWYRYIECDDEWVCLNRDSEYNTELVDDYDTCDEWEKKA